jgi:hypothetical protein
MVSIFENCKLFFRFVHLILKLIDQAEKSPGLVWDPRPLTPTINICLFVNVASDCFWVPSYANETYTSHDQLAIEIRKVLQFLFETISWETSTSGGEIQSSTAVLGKIDHSACFIHVLLSLQFL